MNASQWMQSFKDDDPAILGAQKRQARNAAQTALDEAAEAAEIVGQHLINKWLAWGSFALMVVVALVSDLA